MIPNLMSKLHATSLVRNDGILQAAKNCLKEEADSDIVALFAYCLIIKYGACDCEEEIKAVETKLSKWLTSNNSLSVRATLKLLERS